MQPAFVGRERELATLHDSLTAAATGRGRLLLLSGDPGIGKTRLASHFAAAAAERGALVAWGRCRQREAASAYAPWVDIVDALLTQGEPNARRSQLGDGAADIAEIVPAVRRLFTDITTAPAIDPGQARLRLFESVVHFLSAVAAVQPVVLILDDLHATDDASLRLFEALASRVPRAALLLLATFRSMEAMATPGLAATLSALDASVEHVTVAPLVPAHVAALVAQLWGAPVAPTPAAAIAALCGGNPFYATECARLLRWRDSMPPAALPGLLPTAVHEILVRRIAELSPPTRAALTLAAVAGDEIDTELLQYCLEQTGAAGASATQVATTLAEAAQAGLILTERRAPQRLVFAHALIQETLYQEIGAERRVHLHRDIGEALLARQGDHGDAHDLLAYHFFAAEPTTLRTLELLSSAAGHAAGKLAYEQAALQFERMLKALELGADPALCAKVLGLVHPLAAQGELCILLADARWKAGDLKGAQLALAQAAQHAREWRALAWATSPPTSSSGRDDVNAAVELLGRAALGFGVGAVGVPTGSVDRSATTLLEEALQQIAPGDSPLRARLLARLAEQLYYDASMAARRDDLTRASLSMARRLGNPLVLLHAISSRLWATNGPDSLAERLRLTPELSAFVQGAGLQEAGAFVHVAHASDLAEAGDMSGADACIAAQGEVAESLRQPVLRWQQLILRAMRAHLSGRFADAEGFTRSALELGRALRPDYDQVSGAQLYVIYRELERLAELEPMVRRLAAGNPNIPAWRAALADLLCRSGREAEARREYLILADGDFAGVPRNVHFLLAVALLTDVCVRLPEAPAAASLYDLLQPFAGRNIATSGVVGLGAADRYLAALAVRLDRIDAAKQHFEEAITFNARQGAWPYLAHAQRDYGAMLLHQGGRGGRTRAQDLLSQALATYESLDMRACAERVRELLGWPLADTTGLSAVPVANNRMRYLDGRWRVEFAGQSVEVIDGNGMRYLAALLRERTLRATRLAQLTRRQNGRRDDSDSEQAERDRKSVRKALRLAMQSIRAAGHVLLATHLEEAIITGGVCRYRPRTPTEWEL